MRPLKFHGLHPFGEGINKCLDFLKNPDLYNRMMRRIREERMMIGRLPQGPENAVILIAADLLLSLLCLWLALWLITGVKTFFYKKYLWFLFILNFGWFVILALFKGIWEVLYFMVIRLEPNLSGIILDNFTLAVMAASFSAYIWLLARTFNVRFCGALRLFFLSHLFYFLLAFALSISLNFMEADWQKPIKQNLGLGPITRSYLLDMHKISSRRNTMSLMRWRAFHL